MFQPESSPKVLLIDDDLASRTLIREALEEEGFVVAEASEGRQAVPAFTEHSPALVIIDVLMPGVDGLEACQALRALPAASMVPVLLMTGLNDLASIDNARALGATDFVTKPIQPRILCQRIRYMLRDSQRLGELTRGETSLAMAQRIAKLGSWELDLRDQTFKMSREASKMLGFHSPDQCLRVGNFLSVVHEDDREAIKSYFDSALSCQEPLCTDLRVTQGGAERLIHLEAELVTADSGAAVRIVGTFQDVTERMLAEMQIHALAYYDELTGLPNRPHFKELLNEAIEKAKRGHQLVAVLFLDLDRFKRINDTLGHSVGDMLLKEVSNRLREVVRSSDILSRANRELNDLVLARIGGDEFTLVLPELLRIHDAAKVARRLLDAIASPFTLQGQEVFVSLGIGIAVYPVNGDNVDALLKNADTALSCAKKQGGNSFQFYSRSMNATAFERLSLEACLRRALERHELVAHYQPQVSLQTGQVVGVEALVRWRRPDHGLLLPGAFLPVAEEAGLIRQIDSQVLHMACLQSKAWGETLRRSVRVAVNVSNQQFQEPGLAEIIGSELRTCSLDAHLLELELTESIMMQNPETAIDTVQRLRALGVELSIDDFGTGYSCLNHLRRLQVNRLKVDRSFVRDIATSADNVSIVKAIIAMAQSLGLEVIAEGVETEEQLEILTEHGCDQVQGNLISVPVDASAMSHLLAVGIPLPRLTLAAVSAGGEPTEYRPPQVSA